jgi:hypothetical protein
MRLKDLIGQGDVLFITFDSLRYDVAARAQTPLLRQWLPNGQWQARHSPGSFTYAAHHAFFAGFLPTPLTGPQGEERLFAARFEGSRTIGPQTFVFEEPDLMAALAGRGYHTICIGGVGFFNQLTPLSQVLPQRFAESHWTPAMGVTSPTSTEVQIALAVQRLQALPPQQRVFLFINISAIHTPNYFYLPGATQDSLASHQAALEYVDGHLGVLFQTMQRRAPTYAILCSDHGTAYGEDSYQGHRLAHPSVWTVPYAEFLLGGVLRL